jgi:DNA polymerase III delta prime subunit
MIKSEILDKQLFWEKYRPSNVVDLIVPDRIKKIAEKGIEGNYIFHGNSGCGKSSLARILLKNYEGNYIILSSKLGVDELRNKVDRFCRELNAFSDDPNKLKVVYFEEFDRASSQLQDELKSFIEDHSKRVRFLATCNNISKIKEPIRSRFMEIDFTPHGDETKELKSNFAKRVVNICETENINIDREVLKDIINKRFPDFRKVWQDVQQYHLTGVNSSVKMIDDNDIELFKIILDKKNTVKNWEYLYTNWVDKTDLAFQKLGRDFFDYIKENHADKYDKLGMGVIMVSDYTDLKLPNSLDPFVTLCALIFKLQEIYGN